MSIVTDLTCDGFSLLPTAPFAAQLLARLETARRYPGHVKTKPSGSMACHELEDILAVPGPLKLALDVTGDVADYLGQEPVLYSMNVVRSFPTSEPHPNVQEFHRDWDDKAFIAMFTYLTPVLSYEDGPHELRVNDRHIAFYGLDGMTWLENPALQHRGLPPTHGERVILWARWGVSERPKTYDKDGLSPVPRDKVADYPSDPTQQRIIRLLAA